MKLKCIHWKIIEDRNEVRENAKSKHVHGGSATNKDLGQSMKIPIVVAIEEDDNPKFHIEKRMHTYINAKTLS